MDKLNNIYNKCHKLGKEYQIKHNELKEVINKYKELSNNQNVDKEQLKRINSMIDKVQKELLDNA